MEPREVYVHPAGIVYTVHAHVPQQPPVTTWSQRRYQMATWHLSDNRHKQRHLNVAQLRAATKVNQRIKLVVSILYSTTRMSLWPMMRTTT